MRYNGQSQSASASRPDWTYTVQAPRTFSALWVLERMSIVSVPLAGIGLLAVAHRFGLIAMN